MILWLACFWGFAEATLFFIVPDVLLTFIALFDLELALQGCLFALFGALIGGLFMYRWGKKANASLLVLPGISAKLMERERKALERKGIWAIFMGPLKGIPYKIYAVHASSCGISMSRFVAISVPARVIRFLVAVLLTYGISRGLLGGVSLSWQIGILFVFWILFYSWYFWKFR